MSKYKRVAINNYYLQNANIKIHTVYMQYCKANELINEITSMTTTFAFNVCTNIWRCDPISDKLGWCIIFLDLK